LEEFIEIGERHISTEHQIERPCGLIRPDVLLAKVDTRFPRVPKAALVVLPDKCGVGPRRRQLSQAAA
jgi:hypothetical protein